MKRLTNIQKVNIVFLVTLVVEIAASYLPLDFLDGSFVASLLYSQLILAGPAIVYMLLEKRKYSEIVRFKPLDIKTVLMCVLFYFLIRPLLTLANAISMLYSQNTIQSVMFGLSEECSMIVGITVIAIIPAFLEETVYRGVFYNEYRKAKPLTAIILSGFMFGIMHGNLNQFTYAFLMGMIFALLIEATDSIFSTMIVHFCTNALSTVLMFALPTALETLKQMYEQALESGDSTMAQTIEGLVGTEFDIEALMSSTSVTAADAGSLILTYLPPAIIFTILAFLLYRAIARRNGRWESVCAIFGKKAVQIPAAGPQHIVLTEADMKAENASSIDIRVDDDLTQSLEAPQNEKQSLFTWPLIAGLCLAMALMVVNELIIRGIIK